VTDRIILARFLRVGAFAARPDCELAISFGAPVTGSAGQKIVLVRVSSLHFDYRLHIQGEDDLQALSFAMDAAQLYLESLVEQGIPIYVYEPGDLDLADFWRSPLGHQ